MRALVTIVSAVALLAATAAAQEQHQPSPFFYEVTDVPVIAVTEDGGTVSLVAPDDPSYVSDSTPEPQTVVVSEDGCLNCLVNPDDVRCQDCCPICAGNPTPQTAPVVGLVEGADGSTRGDFQLGPGSYRFAVRNETGQESGFELTTWNGDQIIHLEIDPNQTETSAMVQLAPGYYAYRSLRNPEARNLLTVPTTAGTGT